MTINIVKDENNNIHAHLHNRNNIFMARVLIPEEVNYECHTTLYDFLKINHGPLLNKIR